MLTAHPRSPPAKVESKAISPDADQDRDLLVDADQTEHGRESGEKVAGDADAAQHVDVVLVSLQGLLVDVEAEVPPVLVSADHGLNQLLSVLGEVADPKKQLVMTEQGHEELPEAHEDDIDSDYNCSKEVGATLQEFFVPHRSTHFLGLIDSANLAH